MEIVLQDFVAEWFGWIKFIHVFAAMLWGLAVPPAIMVYVYDAIIANKADPNDEEMKRRVIWAWVQIDKIIIVEHITWPIVIITGPILFWASGWEITDPWIMAKLAIILIIYVPLEVYDVWFSHYYMAKIHENADIDPERHWQAREEQLKYFRVVGPTVRITIPALYFLAIAKPSFGL